MNIEKPRDKNKTKKKIRDTDVIIIITILIIGIFMFSSIRCIYTFMDMWLWMGTIVFIMFIGSILYIKNR